MFKFLSKFLDANEKELMRLQPVVDRIISLEAQTAKLKPDQFKEKTAQFRERLSSGETLDDILPETFALVREASKRTIGEKHYPVQLIAALTLHRGAVAEQKTGEGKTLSAIPALYLNALTGRGVHLVTVNDYLARRDAGWMGPIFHLLGLSTSAIIHDQSFVYDPDFTDNSATDWRLRNLKQISRKDAYKADITYGINSEFGFDYLRDNMVSDISQMSQRGFHYAVVDEVDSVLIDEARTPHIISAPDTEPTSKYYEYAKVVDRVISEPETFIVDEKMHTAHFTEKGIEKVEKLLGVDNLYEKDFEVVHQMEASLKAKTLFHIDKEYVVKDGQVVIVDEFTGRLLQGRRFSEGLHQAIEAKEGVPIQQESKTLATISLQNYFRMYQKLAGMTGTAATEAEEFHKIYSLDVVVIPTNKPLQRTDHPDSVYKSAQAKFDAVARDIIENHKRGQPVLVGTTSIEKNEYLSDLLRKKGIPHNVLNAKNHVSEASIIANAGQKGAVTVATNMAGRGVDIILGGFPPDKYTTVNKAEYQKLHEKWKKNHAEVISVGGLHVIGTERHESRRIDNQLRGRSGRQGDPGSTRFYVALDDEIMRLFGGDHVARLMNAFKLPDDVPLEHSMVSKAIEQAQVKVEGFHFDSRKHLVEYDDVLNKQREIVYGLRKKILEGRDLKSMILEKILNNVSQIVAIHAANGITEKEQGSIVAEFTSIIPFDPDSQKGLAQKLGEFKDASQITAFLTKLAQDIYAQREKQLTPEIFRQVEKWVSLQVVDNLWMDHLDSIDTLREGIGLRGYGQRDPLVEYKNEAFDMFERLVEAINTQIAQRIFKVQVQLAPDQMQALKQQRQTTIQKSAQEQMAKQKTNKSSSADSPDNSRKKLGRNDPCPCGSGKKWKRCHYPNIP